MALTTTAHPTLLEALAPARGWPVRIAALVAGVLALTASAKIQVPFYPVPMTFQPLVVLLLGAGYGLRLGGATVASYLAVGAAGLPVFAGTPEKGIGLAYMMGPTGGYLLGFLIAAMAVGWLARRGWDRHFLTMAAAMVIGTALIYLPGVAWLGSVVGWDKPVLEWGLYPFLYGDALKIVIATIAGPALWKLLGRV